MKLRAGAIFAGIGGFCKGFKRSGIETVWAIDIDERAGKTYTINHQIEQFICADVTKVRNSIANQIKLEPVDVLHAGFPCQSFSMAGNRQGFEDPRGQLFFDLIRIIREFGDNKPPVLVFENSPYLQIGQRGDSFFNKIF